MVMTSFLPLLQVIARIRVTGKTHLDYYEASFYQYSMGATTEYKSNYWVGGIGSWVRWIHIWSFDERRCQYSIHTLFVISTDKHCWVLVNYCYMTSVSPADPIGSLGGTCCQYKYKAEGTWYVWILWTLEDRGQGVNTGSTMSTLVDW